MGILAWRGCSQTFVVKEGGGDCCPQGEAQWGGEGEGEFEGGGEGAG